MGPILDVMAGVLENMSNNAVVARTTISAVHRTAQIISTIPNISYRNKVIKFFKIPYIAEFLEPVKPSIF